MLADSAVELTGSGGAAAAAAVTGVHEGGEVGPSLGEDKNNSVRIDEGDRMNYGANRWPRQETLALLKIRSDMDSAFRDSSHKGPLWEEVSRKLAELGYNRCSKKCKEKFENVYKYHKRTKEGRTGKSEGKTYRFFDQLQAFENHPALSTPPPQPPPFPPVQPQNPITTAASFPSWTSRPNVSQVTVPSATAIPMTTTASQNVFVTQTTNPTIPPQSSSQPANPSQINLPSSSSLQSLSTRIFSSSPSSSTASGEDVEGSRKRKRNWRGFFQRLTKDVIKMQEELQRKFLETVEKHERERMVREAAWRMQEMARINREHEILIQERSAAAAKDTAVIAFLQKISGQQTLVVQAQDNLRQPTPQLLPPPPPPVPPSLPPPQHIPPAAAAALAPITNSNAPKGHTNYGENVAVSSPSSRWPKVEVHALIKLRTSLDTNYQENVPKGPLWEEISAGMQRLGYNRSAKRCKEKWENINKYFKKVNKSNKRRPEDSKTCPYFHQLDALYREKIKIEGPVNPISTTMMMEPLMVRPEQQWPPQQENHDQDTESEKVDDQPIEEEEDDDDDDDEDTEEEDVGGGFEMVENKTAASQLGNGE